MYSFDEILIAVCRRYFCSNWPAYFAVNYNVVSYKACQGEQFSV